MNELISPPAIEGDPNATEMLRVWLAHNDVHVSLMLGLWHDSAETHVDERQAWGQLVADLLRHVAHGMGERFGWDEGESVEVMHSALMMHLLDEQRELTGTSL